MMSKHLFPAVAALVLTSGAALSDPLRIATDILPVQSLVAMVAGDLALPDVIVRPGASPHGYALRPSDAQALQDADAVIWIGESLTPWLEESLDTLAPDAVRVTLMDVAGAEVLQVREDNVFRGDDDHGDDDHAHDHDHDHDDHGHDHSGGDPHLWLSPANATLWVAEITKTLSTLDPTHAATYAANAEAALAEIDAAVAEATALLEPLSGKPFVVYHDAYQYFETSFGLTTAGSLALSDAAPPSAARIAEIRDLVAEGGIICAFSEPQFDPGLIESVFGSETEVRVAVLDPLGTELGAASGLYPALIRQLAERIAGCLS
jgi:zinc transport system substrate-binding protein